MEEQNVEAAKRLVDETQTSVQEEEVPYNPANRQWCWGEEIVFIPRLDSERKIHSTNNFASNFALYQHLSNGGKLSERAQPYYEEYVAENDTQYHWKEIFEELSRRNPMLYRFFLKDIRDYEGKRMKDYKGPLVGEEESSRPRSDAERRFIASQIFDLAIELAKEIDPEMDLMNFTS